MNKCWFVLRQSSYQPPEYASPTKAKGKTTRGDLRLGDIVPSPKHIYPVLTQGELPLFSRDMRISSSQLCEFEWDTKNERDNSGAIGSGAPVAATVGVTANAELSAEFKKATNNWVRFAALDTETVQPSDDFIERVLTLPNVKTHIDQQKLPLLNHWTVFMVTGLMIARAGGTVGSSGSKSYRFDGGPDLDVSGALKLKLHGSHGHTFENQTSAQIQGDRVWAIRLAKIHKGLLRRRWTQTEETVGAALSAGDKKEEDVREVLDQEGWENIELAILPATEERQEMVIAMGDF